MNMNIDGDGVFRFGRFFRRCGGLMLRRPWRGDIEHGGGCRWLGVREKAANAAGIILSQIE